MTTLSLNEVETVVFYKRDEIITDLICCEISIKTNERSYTIFLHEETAEWSELISQIESLPGFDKDWHQKIVLPPFAECLTVAYSRTGM